MKTRVSYLEAVSVCVGYADFLAETAKWNAGLFDRWIIVTEPQDEETRWVCNKFNLECLLSEDGRRHTTENPRGVNKGTFNKGRLIERGLQQTSGEGWRIHLDCDIALPHRFRHALDAAELDKETLYGADRIMVKSWDHWQKLLKTDFMQGGAWDYHCRTNIPSGYEVSMRWSHPQMGYVPCGYFQLYHSSQDEWKGIRVKTYPGYHSTACRTDIQFGLKWDRHRRALVPELITAHLESEAAKKGANWNGRTTRRFGPHHHHGHHSWHHHHHHHKHPYSDGE